jgi:cell division initiation protein
MIDLTPLEVRQKKGDFRRAMRGYEPALVDDFLDLVAERMEALVRENRTLLEEVARLREQVAENRERERALTDALVTAQEMREELRRSAERDADLVRREAEAEVARQRSEMLAEIEREQDAIRQMRARRTQLLRSFRAFLERELNELTIAEDTLTQDDEDNGVAPPPPAPRKRGRSKAAPMLPFEPSDEEVIAEITEVREVVDEDAPLPEAPTLEWLSSVLREEP